MISIPSSFRPSAWTHRLALTHRSAWNRPFPAPSLAVFVALQVLDMLSTLLGLRMGAKEASLFLGHLMSVGPVAALLIAKITAVLLVAVAMRYRRPRLVVFLNYWFAAVVTWNLATILTAQLSAK